MSRRGILLLSLGSLLTFNLADGYSIAYPDISEKLDTPVDPLRLLRTPGGIVRGGRRGTDDEYESWPGRWMPDKPNDPTPPPKVLPKSDAPHDGYKFESSHRIQMGRPTSDCDDAKTNLTVDWDRSPIQHTCYDKKILPNAGVRPLKYCEYIPKAYRAAHKCMNESIQYEDDIPIYGTHRPLWPVYGEYRFLPKQRWLHSLEHGGIVMLYHPCANPVEVKALKSLVTGCLWRHVISPYNLLDERRPLALLAWGCRFTMSTVNPTLVKKFIRERALQGPEQVPDDGNFKDGLSRRARIVSDPLDSTLCPDIQES
ncbi:hypothetical protein KM043_001795 [Ampulex compressa]|uniref:Venom protein n=1 Tax=Ampulex compressa TaxID=860918 RepID=A0A1W6EVR0_AMPCP|nr:venom protein [Ampulex compressa]KAG7198824.1 hypothetical protein KM043_001795 [Ampulex compressa]